MIPNRNQILIRSSLRRPSISKSRFHPSKDNVISIFEQHLPHDLEPAHKLLEVSLMHLSSKVQVLQKRHLSALNVCVWSTHDIGPRLSRYPTVAEIAICGLDGSS